MTLDVTDDDDQKADRNTQVEGAAAGQKLQLQSGFLIQKGIQSVEQKIIRNSHSSRNRHAHGADGGVDLRGENLADIAEGSALSKIDEGRNDRLRETLQKSEGKGDQEDLSFSADDAEAAAVVGQNAVQLILPVFVLLYPPLLRQPVNDAAADPLDLLCLFQKADKENGKSRHSKISENDKKLRKEGQTSEGSRVQDHGQKSNDQCRKGVSDQVKCKDGCDEAHWNAVAQHEPGADRLSAGCGGGNGCAVNICGGIQNTLIDSARVAAVLQEVPDRQSFKGDVAEHAQNGKQKPAGIAGKKRCAQILKAHLFTLSEDCPDGHEGKEKGDESPYDLFFMIFFHRK